MLDLGWRGAEAFHFYLLGQRQLFEGNVEAALVTSLHLRAYDDIISTEQIEALIALCAFYSQAYGQCSKAFIKLESVAGDKREAYEDLAMSIFVRHPPRDPPGQDWMQPSERSAMMTCILTGRPITETDRDRGNVAKCANCAHQALLEFWQSVRHCPLCHTLIHSGGGMPIHGGMGMAINFSHEF